MKRFVVMIAVLLLAVAANAVSGGMEIKLTNKATGKSVTTRCAADGTFEFKNLDAGDYEITFKHNGMDYCVGKSSSSKSSGNMLCANFDLTVKSSSSAASMSSKEGEKTKREAGSGLATGRRTYKPVKFSSSPKPDKKAPDVQLCVEGNTICGKVDHL